MLLTAVERSHDNNTPSMGDKGGTADEDRLWFPKVVIPKIPGVQTRWFKRKEVIYEQGDEATTLYIIRLGAVSLNALDEEGNSVRGRLIIAPNVIGKEILRDGVYDHTARAQSVRVAVEPISERSLPSLWRTYRIPEAMGRLNSIQEAIQDRLWGKGDSAARLGLLLGIIEDAPPFPFTQTNLGDWSNLSRERVSQVLGINQVLNERYTFLHTRGRETLRAQRDSNPRPIR